MYYDFVVSQHCGITFWMSSRKRVGRDRRGLSRWASFWIDELASFPTKESKITGKLGATSLIERFFDVHFETTHFSSINILGFTGNEGCDWTSICVLSFIKDRNILGSFYVEEVKLTFFINEEFDLIASFWGYLNLPKWCYLMWKDNWNYYKFAQTKFGSLKNPWKE